MLKHGHVSSGRDGSSKSANSVNAKSQRTERTAQSWKHEALLVALYLGAIVLANLAVAAYGPVALIISAWLLIPFDLCTRDVLHERWQKRVVIIKTRAIGMSEMTANDGWLIGGGVASKVEGGGLWWKMAALVAAGSLITFILSPSAGRVAYASWIAFGTATTIDSIVYHLAHARSRMLRMNLSNVCSAITDSILFPVIAFGGTTLWLSSSQAAAKFLGGLFWSALFVRWMMRKRGAGRSCPPGRIDCCRSHHLAYLQRGY